MGRRREEEATARVEGVHRWEVDRVEVAEGEVGRRSSQGRAGGESGEGRRGGREDEEGDAQSKGADAALRE